MTTQPLTMPTDLADQIRTALAGGATAAHLTHWQTLDAFYGTDTNAEPDWAALYPAVPCSRVIALDDEDAVPYCEDDCCAATRLTARQAMALAVQTEIWAHMARDQGTDLGDRELDLTDSCIAEELPRVAQRHLADPVWAVQLMHAFHLITARLKAGEIPYPRCTAEEMALHIALTVTDELVGDDAMEPHEAYDTLPVEADDTDFELLRDVLFEDHDVLMLSDLELDGIENDPVAEELGMVSLHPRDWFRPFRSPGDGAAAA
jgi:hypothetical protein